MKHYDGRRFVGPHGIDVDSTVEALTISVDSGSGSDPNNGLHYNTQTQFDALGAFASVPAVINALPNNIIHVVRLEFPDGIHVLDNKFLGDMQRFAFGYPDNIINETDYGRIEFASTNGLVRESGTSTYAVAGTSVKRQIDFQSDPGFSVNEHQSKFLRVVSGTGAGQMKAILSHSGVNFPTAGRWSPIPDATSIVEIIRPAAKLQTSDTYPVISTQVRHPGTFPNILCDAIDIESTGSAPKIYLNGSVLRLNEGSRIFASFGLSGAALVMSECVIDGQSISTGITISAGLLRASSGAGSWVIRNMKAFGINLSAGGGGAGESGQAYIWEGSIINTILSGSRPGHGVVVENFGAICDMRAGTIQGSGNDGSGISLIRGGLAIIDASQADAEAETIYGTAGDIDIDGIAATWSDLNSESDLLLKSVAGSVMSGV